MRNVTGVLLVSRNTLFLDGLRLLLSDESDMTIVSAARTEESALRAVDRTHPDVVVISSDLGDAAVASIPERIRVTGSTSRVIVIGAENTPPHVLELVRMGISAYLPASVTHGELKAVIRSVAIDSERVTISLTRDEVASMYGSENSGLTRLEITILGMVAAAMTNGQIANRLSLSEATVKRHLRNIFRRLGAVSRLDAVNKASSARIIA